MDYINIFIKSIFVDNMIFAFFLGMCSYLAVSKTVKTSAGLGIAVTFVLLITVPINYLLNKFFLAPGALAWISPSLAEVDLSFLSLIMFIAVIAAIVQMVEMIVEKFSPALYNSLGIFLPLIAVNCAVMSGSLFMQERGYANIGEATVFALGSGIGWFLHRGHRRHTREAALQPHPPCPARRGHHLHHHRPHGHGIHELYGVQTIVSRMNVITI